MVSHKALSVEDGYFYLKVKKYSTQFISSRLRVLILKPYHRDSVLLKRTQCIISTKDYYTHGDNILNCYELLLPAEANRNPTI